MQNQFSGSNVSVVEGDAAAMPFQDGQFSGAVSLLHHVHSIDLQNRVFREVRRVLRPGAIFVGIDSLGLQSFWMRPIHLGDTLVPVNPDTLGARLEVAGFCEHIVETNPYAFRFRARRAL